MSFDETRRWEYRILRFNSVHGAQSNVIMRFCRREYNVTRYSNGNEVLSSHQRLYSSLPNLNYTTETYGHIDTAEELSHRMATDLHNQLVGWMIDFRPVSALMAAHVHTRGGLGANFNIEVEVVDALDIVIDQNNGYWANYFIADEDFVNHGNRQRVPDQCPICDVNVANPRERIGLTCGHVFCKNCIYEWIARRSNCPTCRAHVGW